jgi:colanic acid/amylovoran biosynthesis glycosyltransferase
MKVLHLYDKYLNTTMNWAYELMLHTPETDVYVGAAEFVENRFKVADFQYVTPKINAFFGVKNLKNEWSRTHFQRLFFYANKYFFYKNDLKKAIKKHNIDLIHAHFANVGCHYMDFAKALNLPLVVSFYGYDYEQLSWLQPKYKALFPRLFATASAIVCEGDHGAKILTDLGCPPDKIKVVCLGLDFDKVLIVNEKEKQKGTLRLVQAASFMPKKGQLESIKAFAKALKNCPEMHLTFVGEKADQLYYESVLKVIETENISDKVSILDFVESDFYTFLQQFDAFIHPSQYSENRDCEGGAPIVLLNAQAVGLPILSTTHCDIPMEVIHGKTGLLSPEKDTFTLQQNIELFYDMNPSDFTNFSKNAMRHVRENFDIKKNSIKLNLIYKNLIYNNL